MKRVVLNPDGSSALGLLLIVSAPTGVIYEHQCGGFATEGMAVEGFLIPLGDASEAKVIFDWFWNTFKGGCHTGRGEWTNELVAELKELVASIPCWHTIEGEADQRHFLQLDLARTDECIEAWIPVISPYGPAILTLKNSD